MAVLTRELLQAQLRADEHLAFAQIVRAVQAGTCNLFLGSAVHAPPPKDSKYVVPPESLPPIGAGLSQALAEESEFTNIFPKEDATDLQRVAQYYEARLGRPRLHERLKELVESGKQPSPILKGLAALPFPVIVTTNYDTLLQKALGLAGKVPTLSVYHANDSDESGQDRQTVIDVTGTVTPDAPFLFKMHGDIQGYRSIVITEEDYIQFILRFRDNAPYHSIPLKVLESIKSAPTLFIGYSLRDYNLRVWLKMLRQIVDRTGYPVNYSVDLAPDPVIFDVWSSRRRYINFVAGDVWDFVPRLYQTVRGQELPA